MIKEYWPPQHVVDVWKKQCDCCPECSPHPCDGVRAGGMCDGLECQCDYDYEDEDDDHGQYESGDWIECWNCGGNAYVDHDCGEDICCCLYPDDNVVCDICNGFGGWIRP